jgi:CheY-like chemotaxis protein
MALNDTSVLMVEDDPVFRNLVAAFLRRQGAIVTEAQDGLEGLAAFRQYSFDVVLADLGMPNMGGLEMLKEMARINPQVPAIVISGNNVMADVIEALRVGASDYLVKPVPDLFIIEQAIKQCLVGPHRKDAFTQELDEISYQELNENIALLEKNSDAAESIQQQLFPQSDIVYPKAKINFSLFKKEGVSAYFIDSAMAGENHLIMYMAHFYPQDNRAAFASVLLRSFVNHKLKNYRNGLSTSVIEPFSMLGYLNERMLKSGLDIYVDIIYVAIELTHYRVAIAQAGHGLRCYLKNSEGLSPLALPYALQLGVLDWGQPSSQFRTLMDGEQLCIATSEPAHQAMLLENQYHGLIYAPQLPCGGYVSLGI